MERSGASAWNAKAVLSLGVSALVALAAPGAAAQARSSEERSRASATATSAPERTEADAPAAPAPAPPAPRPDETSGYRTVVVAQRDREDPFLSARSVSALSRQDLQDASPRTLPEALREVPGTFAQATSPGAGSPIIRGMVGPQVLILVDGVRLNNSTYRTGPVQYLNLVDPLWAEGIEVLRGPGSVQHGSDAMGGVVLVQTLSPPDARASDDPVGAGSLLLRGSSADLGTAAHARAAGGAGGFGALATGSFREFGDLRGGRGVGEQPFSGYSHGSAMAKVRHRFTSGPLAGGSVSAAYFFSRILDAGRTDALEKRSLRVYDNDDHLAYARLSVPWPALATEAALTLSYQDFFERKHTYEMAPDLRERLAAVRDDTTARTLGADLHLTTRLLSGRLPVRYGGAWYRDRVDAGRWSGPPDGSAFAALPQQDYPDGSRYDTFGAYLAAEGEPVRAGGGHALRLSGGYRLHGMAGHAPARATVPAVDFTQVGHVFHAGAQYVLRGEATVALSFSQGFRAPNLQEAAMLGDTGKLFHVPNPGLAAERSDTVELLARGRLGATTLSAAGYVSLLSDLIRRVPTTWEGQTEVGRKPVMMDANGGRGVGWGAEAQAAAELGAGFSVALHASYSWGAETLADGSEVPLSFIPPLFGAARVRYDHVAAGGWRGFVQTSVRAAAKQDRLSPEDRKDPRIPAGGTPAWWTWNLAAGLRVREHLRLELAVENLLDAKYRYHASGVWAAGTGATLTACIDL